MKIKTDNENKSNRLINNVSDDSWKKLKELAKINSVTLSRMIELLIEHVKH